MNETLIYLKKNYLQYSFLSVFLVIVLLFFDISYALGYLFGYIIFILVMSIKIKYIDNLLSNQIFLKGKFIFTQLIIYLLMLSGFIFSLKIKLINPYTYFLGFIGFKLFLLLKGGR